MRLLPSVVTPSTPITRREAVRLTTVGSVALATMGCLGSTEPASGGGNGRLTTRVKAPTRTIESGLHDLGLGSQGRDGSLYVPTSYQPTTPAPLAVLLHGAGHDASEMIEPIQSRADATGVVLLAPDSRSFTWDAINGPFGADAQFIDKALMWTFDRVRVDASRVRIVGFSDGGTYAISLGLINGDFFTRIVAFSPGFIVDGPVSGKPKFFITHGTRDPVLPIDATSRQIVPQLRSSGYDVEYHEFDGGHSVTPVLLDQAIAWTAD